ncbi:pollen receptor-like kinase 4 [Typha latifolia]|uniref:pollen receptor-like kinase 4 n=1 Tax=Typha latifolia TaxID=4733 RepID=UPI003C2EFF3B
MADEEAAPWPFHLLTLLLSILSSLRLSPGAGESDVLLVFKATLSSGGGDVALHDWTPMLSPCKGNATLWTGVICSGNGTVVGLQLDNMNLSGNLNVKSLADLPQLRMLSFENNSFDGAMPEIAKLGGIETIYLSGNRLTGEIPDGAFAETPSLKKVYLSRNDFSGPIPASLTGLSKLVELGLEKNYFEGEIPDFRQPGLAAVNVADNNLEGPIPAGLSKFDASMFADNKNLCGPPLGVACSSPPPPSSSMTTMPYALLIDILVISIVVLLITICILTILLCHHQRHRQKETIEAADVIEQGAVARHAASPKKAAKEVGHAKLVFVRDKKRRFELEDLLMASAEVLGSGNFGSSYKTAVFDDGGTVVVKKFKKMNEVGREEFQEHMRRLGKLSHPNLLPLVAYLYKKEEKLLISDYIPSGSLAHMLHGNRGSNLLPLDWPARLKVIKGIARGLSFLYREFPTLSIPHGHLKSSNVLLDASFAPILTDYALAPVMNQSHASQVMVAFKSPECARLHGKPCRKSDVWSFGILILEILTGEFPTTYLRKGPAGADLASWVQSVVGKERNGEVFDAEMKRSKNGEGEMLKLLHIALECCEADVEKRWELDVAVRKIEELRERESDEKYTSYVSEKEGGYSSHSQAMAGDELSI